MMHCRYFTNLLVFSTDIIHQEVPAVWVHPMILGVLTHTKLLGTNTGEVMKN